MHQRSPAVRAGILEAAARVILREGAEHFTISRVAREAGLSVGGLRYHFASKHDLLVGLVDHAVAGFDAALAAAGDAPGSRTRAYIDATLSDTGSRELAAALVATVAVDSRLLAVLRAHFARWQAMLDDDGIDDTTAVLVRLAMDGWWLAAFVDLAPPRGRAATELRTRLNALVTEATGD
ncbi:TetR/AcrR family transcriptional regulator [Agromyces larvae]|uniref:TetR/AcrR family transcriptional regulator n=1 Tax=Agromyces larvae TaxID=2929802 RepID=A0ABY4C5E9_9MICO|nr:TetR family transcriptional regulator [Agromyces larvae]UOE45662.1 TetR/AcrR family transcriptional regulator [Agromyces larvae]